MDEKQSNKEHHRSKKGQKEKKEKVKDKKKLRLVKGQFDEDEARKRNPKAFAIQNVGKTERRVRRKKDINEKRKHLPTVDRTPLAPPPIVVAIVGPPKVGKSTLLRSLVKNFTKQNLTNVQGPVTVVSGKHQRLTLIECSNDINMMVDVAKVADLVLVLVDAAFGFEMEVFEFLNICQVHGFPRIMGVLTHLDEFKSAKVLRKTKKVMKHRFWTEVYQGAKLFYLSGLIHGNYQKTEVHNLGRFISVMKFRPLTWRESHPYVLADRMEDLTNQEEIRINAKCDRKISLYGYVRGTNIKNGSGIHIPGAGDFTVSSMTFLPDPCPLPETESKKRRSLQEKDKSIYAPFSGVGGIVYDKDAVYIDLGGSHSYAKNKRIQDEHSKPSNALVKTIIESEKTLDEKMEESEVRLFSESAPLKADEVGSPRQESVEFVNGDGESRIRRKAVFDNEIDDDSDDESENEDDENEDEDEESDDDESEPQKMSINQTLRRELGLSSDEDEEDDFVVEDDDSVKEVVSEPKKKKMKVKKVEKEEKDETKEKISQALAALESKESEIQDEEDEESEVDDEEEEMSDQSEDEIQTEDQNQWKNEVMQKASDAFYERLTNTTSLRKLVYGQNVEDQIENGSDDEELGGLFKVIKRDQEAKSSRAAIMNQRDCTKFAQDSVQDWSLEDVCDSIKDCFVTGKWKKAEDAEELLKLDQMEDDEDVFGDFEDLETGEVHKAEENEDDDAEDAPRIVEDEKELKKKRLEKKRKLKAAFDAEYDDDGGKAYYDELKKEVDQQTMLNRSEFEGMEDSLRVQYEGYRPGMYVRMEIDRVPCEMITNFDPTYPIIVGGLKAGEDQIGYVQVRLKKHRWYPKILKNKDPLIFSLGWRRFQTLPVYAITEHNLRHRMIKYTPQHLHCDAHIWAPVTPQGTGFVAVQTVSDIDSRFRIAATGVVLEMDKSTQVVKKLKLTGEPFKIFKKTAFIKGMFNSSLEVAKFEGAAIKTVSGLRGQIKKGLSTPEGCFRATFEDKILLSDIVFVKTWFKVEIPKFYATVNNLLMIPEEKSKWRGMRTKAEIKRSKGIQAEPNPDHLYRDIVRKPKVFNDLKVPRNLQKELPYRLKPKLPGDKVRDFSSERVHVALDNKEKKVRKMMNMLNTLAEEKESKLEKEKNKRIEELIKKQSALEEKKFKRQKEARRQVARVLSKERIRKEKMAAGGGKGRKKMAKM